MASAPGYDGEIAPILCGTGGLAANLNPSRIPLRRVITAEGITFRQDHWRREPGTALFGSNISPIVDPNDALVVALTDWHPTETIQRIVHLRGDGFLFFTSNGGTNPGAFKSTTTSGSGTRFGYFVNGGSEDSTQSRKLFVFRKNHGLTYVNGDVTNDVVIPKPAADWTSGGADAHPPIVGVISGGAKQGARLAAAGNDNAPHNVYFSKFGDQTDFQTVASADTDFQVLEVFPGVGERIYGLRTYQGYTIVFKYPVGIFAIDASDPSPLNWSIQQITDTIGLAQTPYAALQLENDVLFLASDGQFYLLSAVITAAAGHTNMEAANLGMRMQIYQFLLNAYNRNNLPQMQSTYFPFWQTAIFTIPGVGSQTNNTLFYWDFNAVGAEGGEPRFSYSFRDKAASISTRRNPTNFIAEPFYGDYLGNIILMEQNTGQTWNLANYPFVVQTPLSNLGELEVGTNEGRFVRFANRNKQFDFLEIEYVPFSEATMTVTVIVDSITRQTLQVPLTVGGAVIGTFILGQTLLAGGTIKSKVHRLNCGEGRRISFLFQLNQTAIGTNNPVIGTFILGQTALAGGGEDVAITHLYVYFRVGDTKQVPRGIN